MPRLRTARPAATLKQGRGEWYRISNNAGADVATVHIFDEIGWIGVSASDFIAELKAIDARNIDLHLSSPGGDVFDGIAIHNALRSHRARVTVQVQALAASIASVIAMAGDRIVMAPHSQLMIHDAMTVAVGNSAELRETADLLDRQSDNLSAIYAERAGGTAKQWRKAMVAETWYSAKEAVAAGLADEVAKPVRQDDEDMPMAASWDLSIFQYRGRAEAPAPDIEPEPKTVTISPDLTGAGRAVFNAAKAGVAAAAELVEQAVAEPESTPVVGPEPEPAPVPEVEPAPVLAAFDPAAFRNAMQAAADPMPHYDPGHLRDLMAAVRDDAPAAPEPARPAPVYVPPPAPAAPQPAPAPVAEPGFEADRFRDLMAGVATDAPAPPVPTAPEPAYVPPPPPETPTPGPAPVAEPGFDPARFRDLMAGVAHDAPAPAAPARPEPAYVPPPTPEAPAPAPLDAHTLITDYFRAAMNAAANDAPAPPTQAAPEREPPDPIPAIDKTAFERSLREARL